VESQGLGVIAFKNRKEYQPLIPILYYLWINLLEEPVLSPEASSTRAHFIGCEEVETAEF